VKDSLVFARLGCFDVKTIVIDLQRQRNLIRRDSVDSLPFLPSFIPFSASYFALITSMGNPTVFCVLQVPWPPIYSEYMSVDKQNYALRCSLCMFANMVASLYSSIIIVNKLDMQPLPVVSNNEVISNKEVR